MHTLVLSRPEKPSDLEHHLLVVLNEFDELKKLKEHRARVFKTRVSDVNSLESPESIFTFTTTSKDLHLQFGCMTSEGQFSLAKLLQKEFGETVDGQLLLRVEEKEHRSYLVTRAGKTFAFAEAH